MGQIAADLMLQRSDSLVRIWDALQLAVLRAWAVAGMWCLIEFGLLEARVCWGVRLLSQFCLLRSWQLEQARRGLSSRV